MTPLMQTAPIPTAGNAPFTAIAPGIGFGAPLPAGWASLADAELLVLVGVTGAGKSTALAALDERRVAYSLLPDRRVVTDRVIIPLYDAGAVLDRVRRFEITQRFTRDCPGGMAAVLAGMAADAQRRALPLVFDGLRGEVEVTHAAASLPNARFLVLTAPDAVRLNRLLRRGDAFDRATASGAPSTGDLDLPGAED
ncbi:MAG TPA: AAA family ATPase, partial [Azospirillum sp.]